MIVVISSVYHTLKVVKNSNDEFFLSIRDRLMKFERLN